MGFISSATTITLDSHLTQKGREVILSGISKNITKFTLGDSDTNYLITTRNSSGKVPDVTGDHIGCVFSVARNVDIKNKISVSGLTEITTKELRFINNNQSYNILNVEVDLGNYCAYLDSQSSTTTFNSNLKSPIIDFYDFIRIEEIDSNNNTVGFEYDNVMVEFKNQQDYNIFTKLQNDYLSEQITSNQNKFRNKNFNNLVDSPLKFLFSSINNLFGAGPGGVVLFGREYGYSIVDTTKPTTPLNVLSNLFNPSLPQTTTNFFKPDEVETNTNLILGVNRKLVPSVRVSNPFNPSQKEVFVTSFETSYNDNTGSHDHIKRFGNQVIAIEILLMVQTMGWLSNLGLGQTVSNVDYVSIGMDFISQGIQSKRGELNITFKMDKNTNNWNQNGDFITIL